ncbi:hypothetical protein evm_009271 [Chilo suppressalis]|nr:hypothetical protein evm_009271 [Chilo suppressalis]
MPDKYQSGRGPRANITQLGGRFSPLAFLQYCCECRPPRNWGSTLGILTWPVSPLGPTFTTPHESTLCLAQLPVSAASSRQRYP